MADLLGGAKRFGTNLLDFVNAYGSQRFTPINEPDPLYRDEPAVQAARAQYDQDFRAARAQAVRAGAGWGSMNAIAGSAAEQKYDQSLGNAYKQAEAIRAARDARRRQEMIDKYVSKSTGFNEDQREFLLGATPQTQEELIAKTLFPKALQGSQGPHSAFEGANGNMWVIGADGKASDTGAAYNDTPSKIRALQMVNADPALLNAVLNEAGAGAYGAKQGEANAAARSTLPGLAVNTNKQLERYKDLRKKLETADTGRLDQYAGVYDSELQALEAELNLMGLENIGYLKSLGVSLQPITEKELAVLFSTQPRIGNNPAANLAIMDARIASLQAIKDETDAQLRWIRSGRSILDYGIGAPGGTPAPVAGPPASTGPASRGGARRAGGRETENDFTPPPPPGTVIVGGR